MDKKRIWAGEEERLCVIKEQKMDKLYYNAIPAAFTRPLKEAMPQYNIPDDADPNDLAKMQEIQHITNTETNSKYFINT